MRFSRYGKNIRKCIRLSVVGIAALLASSAAWANLIVIGNPELHIDQLNKSQVSSLYLGKTLHLHSKEQLIPVDQRQNSIEYQNFYKQMLDWDVSQVSSYWSSLVFSGDSEQPQQVSSDAQAIATVEANPGAVAYIEANSLRVQGGHVKVLYGDFPDNSPGNNYFPGIAQHSDNTHSASHANANNDSDSDVVQQTQMHNQSSAVTNSTEALGVRSLKGVSPYMNNTVRQGNVWDAINANMQLLGDANNPQVQHEVLWFLSHRSDLKMFFKNAEPYIGYVYEQVQARHMPAEIALLPMIESGYDPLAYSQVGAAGLWQMMPGTASSYGLDINWWYDSRSDIVTSTTAALNYLVQLHSNLGSWKLALAAYDAGQGAVQSAVNYAKRSGRDPVFWNLPLPNETRNYVPKLLAVAYIVHNAARYHVSLPFIPAQPYFSSVTLNSQIDLKEAAHLAQIPELLVHILNPGLRRYATNPDMPYNLLIPASRVKTFEKNLGLLAGHTHISWQYHEVHHGETVTKIAHDYHMPASLIRRVNHLSGDTLVSGEGILVPLYLNHKYEAPLAVNNELTHNAFNGQIAQKVSAQTLLKKLPKATKTPPVKFPVEGTQSLLAKKTPTHKKVVSVPIKKTDSLKTLIGKIYGSD